MVYTKILVPCPQSWQNLFSTFLSQSICLQRRFVRILKLVLLSYNFGSEKSQDSNCKTVSKQVNIFISSKRS